MCPLIDVAHSNYYKWRDGRDARAERERADEGLAEKIRAIHTDSEETHRAQRITAELRELWPCLTLH
ncbi:hypothetical protein [Streptomyces osmaniensis]|uniref:Transposase n=1 Tax=Streptomyces osmaniensis TaxID=593134 RepID=A0ABP6Z938_9ACTN|nr:hypothetical protein KJK32_45090 [Streptomyces sp. JCM17656]